MEGSEYKRKTATLKGHMYMVRSVAFSPDGLQLASGSEDCSIKLWEVSSGKEIATLKGHVYSVNSVAFSLDGKRLASGSGDSYIKLWIRPAARNLTPWRGTGIPSIA